MEEERDSKEERHRKLNVLDLAMDAGQLLLENGAEISRVEETLERICRYYGVESEHFFILSNGIFITAGSEKEPKFAKVRQLSVTGGRLDWVCAVNQLSREIEEGKYTVEEAQQALNEIRKMPGKSNHMLIIAGAVGAGAFCRLFGGDMMDVLSAALVGFLLQLFMKYVISRYLSKIVGTICGGAFITLFCIILQNLHIGHHLDKMVIGTVMLLVPGVAFVNGIRDIADSDYLSGAVRLLDAILRFACIAIGVGVLFMVYHAVFGGRIL